MTSRPDRLPIDLKRQGRCEEHIALFYPETPADREAIASAMARKLKLNHTITDWMPITQNQQHLSGADIESILIRARRLARLAGSKAITQDHLANAAFEFTPARDEQAIEYQELVAAREATSRSMLPERFKQLTPAEMTARIDALRLLTH